MSAPVMSSLNYWNPVLKNAPQVKWVIEHKSGLKGYETLEDAKGDWPHVSATWGNAVIYKVSHPDTWVAVGKKPSKKASK